MAKRSGKEWLTSAEIFADLDADPEARAVGDAVIAYRIKHGLSQRALAARLGMRQSHIARLEASEHNPSVETLQRLAEKLGLRFVLDVRPAAAEALTLPSGVAPAQEVVTADGARVLVAAG